MQDDRIVAEMILLNELAEGEKTAQEQGWISVDDAENVILDKLEQLHDEK